MKRLKAILSKFNLCSVDDEDELDKSSQLDQLLEHIDGAHHDIEQLPRAFDMLLDLQADLCNPHCVEYVKGLISRNDMHDRAMIALDRVRGHDGVVARATLGHVIQNVESCIPEAVDVMVETLGGQETGSNFNMVCTDLAEKLTRSIAIAQVDQWQNLHDISPFDEKIGTVLNLDEYRYDMEISHANGGYNFPYDREGQYKLLLGLEYFQQSGLIADDHQTILGASIKALRVSVALGGCDGEIGSALVNDL
ncbi:MAG: hypothetical protein ACRBDL_08705 [Alphaproteobacteria bacterium]